MATIVLKKGREKSLLRHHPWLFSGAIGRVSGAPQPGESVTIVSADGCCHAIAAFSPQSQIRCRVWSFDPAETIDARFFFAKLQNALALRKQLPMYERCTAFRLINGESDGLGGLIVDRYADFLVCQFTSAGAERWKKEIVNQLVELFPDCSGIYERSDVAVRKKEGLEPAQGVLWGKEPPQYVQIQEYDHRFLVDIHHGHKTGFYLDQRDSRQRCGPYVRNGEVLNCFSYTGPFCISCLAAGAARVTNVDVSSQALMMVDMQAKLNGFPAAATTCVEADVFAYLRTLSVENRSFDVIVLDPPKFAESQSSINRACRGYKDINMNGLRLVRPGGKLVTFSCSGLISDELFQKIVADAALDANRIIHFLEYLHQAPDHAVSASFPEARYLKGLICHVT
ncbi:MAG: class I SAM-dependent methyltransferase [Chitinivibrionales bacterium]|nr:class I SAM-dependent methyltransferase [Chitinivibrionales bacterium]